MEITHNAGLRNAEYVDSKTIICEIGASFSDYRLSENTPAFQIISQTDAAFKPEVRATSVTVLTTELDGNYPKGYKGPKFNKYRLKILLPDEHFMKDGHQYWLRINSAYVRAKNKAAVWIQKTHEIDDETRQNHLGVREVFLLKDDIIHLITGPGIDLKQLNQIAIVSEDDSNYTEGVTPLKVGRRSNLDFYTPRGWPWQIAQRHELFLKLPHKLQEGKSYEIDLNRNQSITCGDALIKLSYDSTKTQNLAIKVNQIGYLPDAKKYAYLGMWAGDWNAIDFKNYAKKFQVRNAISNEIVFTSDITLRQKATYRLENGQQTPDPQKTKGPETVYKSDLSYEDVYQMDFTQLNKVGKYYIVIPGLGRSMDFQIQNDVYLDAFQVIMNGLLHQRAGIDLKEPYSVHYRFAAHRNKTEKSDAPRNKQWKELLKYPTDGVKHDIWGGHYDAGDWNPRSHLSVAENLLVAYQVNPKAFHDGQLNIPENQNGIPDILDEAWWALDLWNRLQDEDGGVRGKIESEGDPRQFDSAETDSLREFAYGKDAYSSYRFAAVAAQMSRIYQELKQTERASQLQKNALRAYAWADQNGGEKEQDMHSYAAVMLWQLTAEEKFHEDFKKYSIYTQYKSMPPFEHAKHDQRYGNFYYCLAPNADETLKKNIIKNYEALARYWLSAAKTTTYRYMRSPYAPNTWGTGGIPKWNEFPIMTMAITEDKALAHELRDWILFSNDFSLGCHPLNMTFTVHLGQRYTTSAFHHLQLQNPNGLIAGLQSEAAGGRWTAGPKKLKGGMAKWPGLAMYPYGNWPDLYKYSENASPGMNEGVTVNMSQTALSYAIFVPEID
ncbi:MAG: glycoside hydrolase family 9 protein [Lentisphaeria bacterium]|nr:glycoside hydrolase family 9 protein [Lentisphaeria bacterium]